MPRPRGHFGKRGLLPSAPEHPLGKPDLDNLAKAVLDAQWLGVPQARQRTIFIGVREDVGINPVFPKPLPYRYSLRDALPWIVRGKYEPAWKPADAPSPTVSAHGSYNPATSHQGLELVEVRLTGGTGAAIRKVVTRLHRIAPSVVGHPVEVVETRLKEEEDEILKQLHLLYEHLSRWEEPP